MCAHSTCRELGKSLRTNPKRTHHHTRAGNDSRRGDKAGGSTGHALRQRQDVLLVCIAIFSPIQQRQRRAMVFAPALGRDRGLAQCLRDRRSAPDGFRVELRTFLVADNSLAAQRLADSADRWPSRLND